MPFIHFAASSLLALLVAACAVSPADPGEAVRRALAPTGKLRVGLISVPVHSIKDPYSGELRGVSHDLGRELAARLRLRFASVDEKKLVARLRKMSIDDLHEAENAGRFFENFKDDPDVHVPRVVRSLSTLRVLTLEDVYAIKITDYAEITRAGIERGDVAKNCWRPTSSRSSKMDSCMPTRILVTCS